MPIIVTSVMKSTPAVIGLLFLSLMMLETTHAGPAIKNSPGLCCLLSLPCCNGAVDPPVDNAMTDPQVMENEGHAVQW